MVKRELLDIVNIHKARFTKYVIDEMAASRKISVLRLPPYHCELNPIELIWAQVKGEVRRNNTTYKMSELKNLLTDSLTKVTAEQWKKCVEHVIKEEQRMWDLDGMVDELIEPIIISLNEDSSTEDDSDF